jgi:hypothetical protein
MTETHLVAHDPSAIGDDLISIRDANSVEDRLVVLFVKHRQTSHRLPTLASPNLQPHPHRPNRAGCTDRFVGVEPHFIAPMVSAQMLPVLSSRLPLQRSSAISAPIEPRLI